MKLVSASDFRSGIALIVPISCMAGQWETALYWQDRLVRLHKALFLDASPSPTKFAMAHLGLCGEDVRLPIAPCSDAVKPAILEAMREAGLV